MCVYVPALTPALLRHKRPLIKAAIFLPSDNTQAHVKEVGAGGGAEQFKGHWAVIQKVLCMRISACVYSMCVSSARNHQSWRRYRKLLLRLPGPGGAKFGSTFVIDSTKF